MMNVIIRPFLVALLLSGLLATPHAARAAQSYDNCTGFIDALPATISTQGVWCLRKDLSTAIANGNAITIATNNVTIDCNDFKVGGLAAGINTLAYGIYASNRQNATIRHCNIRGFLYGVFTVDGGGHVVEDSRFDNNTLIGIEVGSAGSTIRNNQVFDTGGTTAYTWAAFAIITKHGSDVINNTINGVAPAPADSNAMGIYMEDNGMGSVVGNRIRGLAPTGTGVPYGVWNYFGGRTVILGNIMQGPGVAGGIGVGCGSVASRVKDNVIIGFPTGHDCGDGGGNDIF